ncbi:MAG: aminotransferase class V-fold PLP-dependent enzyme [Candidatus Altiarchaeota archaeon]|nr:aminotransferase class V-fold PLP-dependent enzyme [Candidatus Altiarchaeota archaeon]
MSLNVEKIKEDFPIFLRKIHGKRIIYMDSACVTLKPRQVVEAMNKYYEYFPACAGRSSHKLGRETSDQINNSRKTLQRFINAKSVNEVIFTKNTTEGINLISNSLKLKGGDVILTSDKEHNSCLLPFQLLKRKGVRHEIFKFGNLDDFQSKLTKDVKLVATAHTSNLDGTSNPIRNIIRLAHENNSLVLVDGAQSVPHKKVDVRRMNVDFLAFSGHKMLGPSGTGVLYGKQDLMERLNPLFLGGDAVKNSTYNNYEIEELPKKFEAGLQNYAGIIGLAEAARYLTKMGRDNLEKHLINLNELITDAFQNLDIEILGGTKAEKRGGIISFNMKKINPHEIAGILNESSNIMIRSGMHCVHSWFNAHELKGSARVSLYAYNTREDCGVLIKEIMKIHKLLL